MLRNFRRQRRAFINRNHTIYKGSASASLLSLGNMLPVVIVFLLVAFGKPFINLIQSLFSGFTKVSDGVGSTFSILTDSLGVTKSEIRDKILTTVASPVSCWSPNFYKTIPAASIFVNSYADELCTKIHDACGFIYSDLNTILSVFKICSHQAQVSYLVYRFQVLYSSDLANYICAPPMAFRLRTSLLDSEMQQVIDYVDKLPR